MIPGATVLLYGTASESSRTKNMLEHIAGTNETVYAHVPLEPLFPHQLRVMWLYDNAKKIIIGANATPVSNPAESRSVRQLECGTRIREGGWGGLQLYRFQQSNAHL